MTENYYYKFIKKDEFSFIFNKIYKLQNLLENFENYGSFIDEKGNLNGYSGTNHNFFKPVNEEEYLIQEGIITKKEQNYDYLIIIFKELNIT